MACTGYKPQFQKQINSTDRLGSVSCTAYSGAMAGEYHTCGTKRPTGYAVRRKTGDYSGGTTLSQIDYALNAGWGINLDTRAGSSGLTWAQFAAKINGGQAAIVQGSYAYIRGTRFQGSPSFKGNHAILVLPGWVVMDPLADGRRPGIYKYKGESYPPELIKKFAGGLVLNPRTGRRLGYGYVWCSLTRDNAVSYRAVCKVTPPVKGKYFRYYLNSSNIIVDRVSQSTATGFINPCTQPRLFKAKDGLNYKNKSLVKITSGIRKGWYVSSAYAQEIR